jgi:hypothetical protein
MQPIVNNYNSAKSTSEPSRTVSSYAKMKSKFAQDQPKQNEKTTRVPLEPG